LINVGGAENVHIQIHAHASELGAQEYNQGLSLMRLKSVRTWLTTQGDVAPGNIFGQAWGEDKPYAIRTADNEASQNRRVDVVFLPISQAAIPMVKMAPMKRPQVYK
jgi:outer membrane protein OmpA-like peptidoglycan-associated protein